MNAGEAFYLDDFCGGHLNFILEVLPDDSVIVCNFTDFEAKGIDKACAIEIGEHPKINKKSGVNFRKADHCQAGEQLEALKRLIRKTEQPLSAELLVRIRQHMRVSQYTPDIIKKLLAPPQA